MLVRTRERLLRRIVIQVGEAADDLRAVDHAEGLARCDLEVLHDVVVADVIRADEELRRVQLGDLLACPVGGYVHPPRELRPVHQDRAQRQLVGVSQQRGGVLPLIDIAGRPGEGHQHDLVPCLLARVRVLQREPVEEVDVAADLHLRRVGRLERLVAERLLHRHAGDDGKGLVLGIEGGPQAGGPVGTAQLELVDAVQVKVLREAVRPRDPVVPLPPAVGAEQRRAVPPHQPVNEVAILDVEARDDVVILVPNRDVGGAGGQRGPIDRDELGRVQNRERRGRVRKDRHPLVLVHVGGFGGVAHVPRAEAERSHAGEGGTGVERPAGAVDLHERAAGRLTVRVQEVLRHLVREVGRLLVVVVVPLERQPVANPVGRFPVAGEARAIGVDLPVGQGVQRVRGVR